MKENDQRVLDLCLFITILKATKKIEKGYLNKSSPLLYIHYMLTVLV